MKLYLIFFFLLYIFSTPLPEFESVPNTSNSGWLSCYSKLWINILCLFLFGWPLFISTDVVEVPLKPSTGNCPSPWTLAFNQPRYSQGPLCLAADSWSSLWKCGKSAWGSDWLFSSSLCWVPGLFIIWFGTWTFIIGSYLFSILAGNRPFFLISLLSLLAVLFSLKVFLS